MQGMLHALRWALLLLLLGPLVALTITTPSPMAVTMASAPASASPLPLRLLSTPPEELREHFGWPAMERTSVDKSLIVWSALRKGINVLDPDECAATKYVSPNLNRQLLGACAPVSPLRLETSSISEDGTQKLLVALADGLSVECVIIPMHGGKHTSLCVSSQVGCSRGCAFCSTGAMGLVRSLTTEEILAQVWTAVRAVRERGLPPLVNVVFMGMGEPLNNFEAVERAVRLLVHPKGFALSRRNVCVSTVGPSPALIARGGTLPCRLAWSVHAAQDPLRKLLVPTTAHPMATLRDAFLQTLARKPGGDKARGLLVELALMRGVNDQPEHAAALAHLLRPLGRRDVLVNLIPYNENGLGLPDGPLFQPSRLEDVYAFQRHMWSEGVLCTVRATRGATERSACGQLATEVADASAARRPPKMAAAPAVGEEQQVS